MEGEGAQQAAGDGEGGGEAVWMVGAVAAAHHLLHLSKERERERERERWARGRERN